MEHYFFGSAFRYKLPALPEMSMAEWAYDRTVGAWVKNGETGVNLMVESPSSGIPKPQTKKKDVETGEDLK